MRLRSIYLTLFLAGGLVIAILIAARPSRPAPRPAPSVKSSPDPAPVVATPDEALAATADLFFSGLRALLASPEARPHEATLTFRDDAAFRRFLARASAQGLIVIAQLDALHTVRIRYERIAVIQNDILRHTADYADAAANNYLRIPDKLTTADRAALDLIPLRNTTLAAIGATADRTTWGRGSLNVGWALGRNDPTRVDAALSSHFYDSARAQMEVVIQNRGGQALSGLTLDVDTDGLTANYRVPALTAGASIVIAVPVDKTTLAARGALTYKTTLSAPIGINDQDPTNNIKTSRLTAPKP